MDQRLINPLLAAIESVPARTRIRQVLGALVHPLRRRHLTMLTLMPRLPARLALRELLDLRARLPPPLRPRLRRILRRRLRTVPRVAVDLPLKLLDHHVLISDPSPQRRVLLNQQRNLRPQLNKLISAGHAT
jgi:hypothetical protein